MSADWKEQLQRIIELSRDRVRRLEAEAGTNAGSCAEAARQIEAQERIIALLQRTIDALTLSTIGFPGRPES